MLSASYYFYELILRILAFLADGASAMPLLGALGLLIGRRGHASFCAAGARLLLKLAIPLSFAGLIYFPCFCYVTLLPYNADASWIRAFFSLPGMPWLSSWLAWGAGCAFLQAVRLSGLHPRIIEDRFSFAAVRLPCLLMLAAAFCFFATYFLSGWPFAGAPAELSTQRVLVAVSRNAFRHWFLALSTGGAIALALAPSLLENTRADEALKGQALRWCALWAAACAIPSCLQNWAFLFGMFARSMPVAAEAQGLVTQTAAVLCASFALACWLFCLWKRRAGFPAWLGLALLLLKYCVPLLGALGKFASS